MPLPRRLIKPIAVACSLVFLGACAEHPRSPRVSALPEAVELSGVPFFAQNAYQSAPAALAALLTQQGEVVTPGLLESELRLPQQEESLQRSIADVARQHGLLVYPLGSGLDDLLEQVAAGNPIMVYVKQGYGLLPSWRFALLVGYDLDNRTLLLRSGHQRRMQMGFGEFEAGWDAASRWAVLLQSPDQLPAAVERGRWLKGAEELDAAGQTEAASIARRQMP
ncbi:PA2778 family cysteine peptidase [Pseudomonas boanensis]|uniref:PA2778 family cysteine peptidase n=1 Tax=Metapseudomonas boanensis TaxID=2822138 RepID=UPI0035D432DD